MRRHQAGCVCGWPEFAHTILDALNDLGDLMTEFTSDQAHLDADVKALTDAIAAEVAALKAQPGAAALDFTGLDALVTQTQAAVPASPAPAPAPAASAPSDAVPADAAAPVDPAQPSGGLDTPTPPQS